MNDLIEIEVGGEKFTFSKRDLDLRNLIHGAIKEVININDQAKKSNGELGTHDLKVLTIFPSRNAEIFERTIHPWLKTGTLFIPNDINPNLVSKEAIYWGIPFSDVNDAIRGTDKQKLA